MMPPDKRRDRDVTGDLIWECGSLRIHYRRRLDGGGRELAAAFVAFLEDRFAHRLPFARAFEWCSGPGFIGFALLERGLCSSLCLADINPQAVDVAQRSIQDNDLGGRVTAYLSDGLAEIPAAERFDLVVSNPPNFCNLNPEHHLYADLVDDLRPHDRGWDHHRRFYHHVGRHLEPGAILCISEVEPHEATVFVDDPVERIAGAFGHRPKTPLDRRPRPPVEAFCRMIQEGGLEHLETVPYITVPGGLRLSMVLSTLPNG